MSQDRRSFPLTTTRAVSIPAFASSCNTCLKQTFNPFVFCGNLTTSSILQKLHLSSATKGSGFGLVWRFRQYLLYSVLMMLYFPGLRLKVAEWEESWFITFSKMWFVYIKCGEQWPCSCFCKAQTGQTHQVPTCLIHAFLQPSQLSLLLVFSA